MMAARLRLALLLSVFLCAARARPSLEPTIRLPSERAAAGEAEGADDAVGTRWAVLIAGSNGYYNYRHQVRAPLLRSSAWLLNSFPSVRVI
jgi:legumain